MSAVLDLDTVSEAEGAEICARYRECAVELTVATRPDAAVPLAIRRNLAHGE